MYICICNAVTEREIRQAVDLGATSLAEISSELGVATGCGKCKKEACCIVRDQLRQPALIAHAGLSAAAFEPVCASRNERRKNPAQTTQGVSASG